MLVELRDVEVHIEPNNILTQALQEGDININTLIYECMNEEGAESVLDAVDNSDITDYCKKYELGIELDTYNQIITAIKELSESEKALILWHLLKCGEV